MGNDARVWTYEQVLALYPPSMFQRAIKTGTVRSKPGHAPERSRNWMRWMLRHKTVDSRERLFNRDMPLPAPERGAHQPFGAASRFVLGFPHSSPVSSEWRASGEQGGAPVASALGERRARPRAEPGLCPVPEPAS